MQSIFDIFCKNFNPKINILMVENKTNIRDSWQCLADSGLFRCFFPENSSNMEQRWEEIINAILFLSYKMHDSGLLLNVLFQISGIMIPLNLLGSTHLKEKWLEPMKKGEYIAAHCLTEKNAGTDVLAMTTYAKIYENHLLINGEKTYICNSPFADIGIVYARNSKTINRVGHDGLVGVLIDFKTKGVTVGGVLDKIGLKSVEMASISFDDVMIAKEQIIYKLDGGVHVMQIATTMERLIIPIAFIGIMMKIYDFCREVTKKHSAAEIYLSEIYLKIFSCFGLLEKICKEIHLDKWKRNYITLACMVKIYLSEAYINVINKAKLLTDILGKDGSNITSEYRNALSAWIYSGTNDSLKSMLGKLI